MQLYKRNNMQNSLWSTLHKNLHYFNRYIKFIEYYSSVSLPPCNTEEHHIIPTSLGGTNCRENRIKLPVRVHLIAHILLWKAFPGCNQMSFAVHQMTTRIGNHCKSSRIYESIKHAHSIACANRNTGRKLTPEWKQAIRDGHKNNTHDHLKTEHAREMARNKANTILKEEHVVKKRQATLKAKGENHASKRNEVRNKIGKSHQSVQIIAISPLGERFDDIYITEFTKNTNISKYMIKKYLDKGKIPSPPTPFLARWEKSKNPNDAGRFFATGWEFKSLPLS